MHSETYIPLKGIQIKDINQAIPSYKFSIDASSGSFEFDVRLMPH